MSDGSLGQQIQHQQIAIELLDLSCTESQIERRAHFDKNALKELGVSLQENGLLQAIVVRPVDRRFQIIAGERRYLAAKSIGWKDIACNVRFFSDAQVVEAQLTENLEREKLHELAEAEGYEALQSFGMSTEQIGAKFGRSPSYVARRLRLKTLGKAARRAFYDGKIGFTVALELAKLPIHAHQDELLAEALDRGQWDGPMTAEEIREVAEGTYQSKLAGAAFPTADPKLIPKAGDCNSCVKRTGAHGDLFDQVKGLGNCLDLDCFKAKKKAHGERLLETAKDAGQKVLRNQATMPDSYIRLDLQPDGGAGKSVKQLLGKDYVPVLVQLKSGEVIQAAPADEVKKILPKERPRSSDSDNQYKVQQRAQEKKRRLELDYRAELLRMIVCEKLGADVRADLRLACEAMADRMHHDGKVRIFKVMDWEVTERKCKYRGTVKEYEFAKVLKGYETETELRQLLRILSVAGDLEVYSHADFDRKDRLHKLAERLGLKAAELRKGMEAAAAEKAKPKKKAGKK